MITSAIARSYVESKSLDPHNSLWGRVAVGDEKYAVSWEYSVLDACRRGREVVTDVTTASAGPSDDLDSATPKSNTDEGLAAL